MKSRLEQRLKELNAESEAGSLSDIASVRHRGDSACAEVRTEADQYERTNNYVIAMEVLASGPWIEGYEYSRGGEL